jgi:hypothetical protein
VSAIEQPHAHLLSTTGSKLNTRGYVRADNSALPECQTPFTDLCFITSLKKLEVTFKSALLNDWRNNIEITVTIASCMVLRTFIVADLVERSAKQNIIPDGFILDPRFLCGVSDTPGTKCISPKLRDKELRSLTDLRGWSSYKVYRSSSEIKVAFNAELEGAPRWCVYSVLRIQRPPELSILKSKRLSVAAFATCRRLPSRKIPLTLLPQI